MRAAPHYRHTARVHGRSRGDGGPVIMADDPLIKSVNQSPRVRDALKKSDPDKKQKAQQPKKDRRKKDSKRIIDTYA